MTAAIIPLFRPRPVSAGWSNQELADLMRVRHALQATGIAVETEHGLTDEGDAWFVFCRPATGEVLVHFAKMGGLFVAMSPAFEGALRGASFAELVDGFLAHQPLLVQQGRGDPTNRTVYLHPTAMLTAFVATVLLLSDTLTAAHARQPAAAGDTPTADGTAPDTAAAGRPDPAAEHARIAALAARPPSAADGRPHPQPEAAFTNAHHQAGLAVAALSAVLLTEDPFAGPAADGAGGVDATVAPSVGASDARDDVAVGTGTGDPAATGPDEGPEGLGSRSTHVAVALGTGGAGGQATDAVAARHDTAPAETPTPIAAAADRLGTVLDGVLAMLDNGIRATVRHDPSPPVEQAATVDEPAPRTAAAPPAAAQPPVLLSDVSPEGQAILTSEPTAQTVRPLSEPTGFARTAAAPVASQDTDGPASRFTAETVTLRVESFGKEIQSLFPKHMSWVDVIVLEPVTRSGEAEGTPFASPERTAGTQEATIVTATTATTVAPAVQHATAVVPIVEQPPPTVLPAFDLRVANLIQTFVATAEDLTFIQTEGDLVLMDAAIFDSPGSIAATYARWSLTPETTISVVGSFDMLQKLGITAAGAIA
ncbi:MAG: hypothetical protein ACK5YI_04100 [Rhodospirillales bacterium]